MELNNMDHHFFQGQTFKSSWSNLSRANFMNPSEGGGLTLAGRPGSERGLILALAAAGWPDDAASGSIRQAILVLYRGTSRET
jgi:hypothetical protein